MLRKAKLLRGSNILITEDFPRRVREYRAELARVAKEVRMLALCCKRLPATFNEVEDASRK